MNIHQLFSLSSILKFLCIVDGFDTDFYLVPDM